MAPVEEVVSKYGGLSMEDAPSPNQPYEPGWSTEGGSPGYWDLARVGCAPNSPGRDSPALDTFHKPPNVPGGDWKPAFAPDGFIANFSGSQDICTQDHLRSLHGSFIEPISVRSTDELVPLFGGCKLGVNNDILIPGAMYLTTREFYSGGEYLGPHWNLKKDGIIWRGMASGGRHHAENWHHFHRMRLVEMLNGTVVTKLESGKMDMAATFPLPDAQMHPISEGRKGKIGEWLTLHADAGFNDRLCFPDKSNCTYLRGVFPKVKSIPMKEQYQYKFLPDADGNSFSARFRGFIRSTSLPVKGTIYMEWHDARLIPWLHFVPMDNTYRDLYALLDWFTKDARGDAAAAMIAEAGSWWASKVLRREDMVLYVWRLLLKWARVCDDSRDRLGWVEDLRGPPSSPGH